MAPPNWHFSLMAPIYDSIGGLINRVDLSTFIRPDTGDHVLDVGGGTGMLSEHFNHIPHVSWTVVDLNYRMLRQGQQDNRRCNFVQGSAYELPFRSNRFDYVLITDALHHMDKKWSVLSEVRRVLHEEGLLLIEEFDPDTPIGKLTETAEWIGGMGSQFVRPDPLYKLIRSSGLEIKQTTRHQYLYYVLASPSDSERVHRSRQ